MVMPAGSFGHATGKSILYTYDERGERKIGKATLKGKLSEVVAGLGGTAVGRPLSTLAAST